MAIFKRRPPLENFKMPENQLPICPHCEQSVSGLMSLEIVSTYSRHGAVWTCPHCLTIVGVTERS